MWTTVCLSLALVLVFAVIKKTIVFIGDKVTAIVFSCLVLLLGVAIGFVTTC